MPTKKTKTKKKTKKKPVKKTKKKAPVKRKKKVKKKRKYRITKKLQMEDIYRILNKVQIGGKDARFSVLSSDASMIDNIIHDLGLPYNRIDMKTKTTFIVKPAPVEEDGELSLDLDFLEDEMPEDGQIF